MKNTALACPILCIDMGNTTCRSGVWSDGGISQEKTVSTNEFKSCVGTWIDEWKGKGKIAFCSVVPEAEKCLQLQLDSRNLQAFRLTALNQSLLPVKYPKPEEIGADRIANSFAVFQKYDLPAVVIDLGTATTFDVVTESDGYKGGVILPGPQGMLDYLGNKTALLPQVELTKISRSGRAIGQNTQAALVSGIIHGYLPMIQGVLGAIKSELEQEGEILQSVVQTGGESKNFHLEGATIHPNLTLEGLALACLEQQASVAHEC